jgi:hypothetical protein
MFEAQADQRRQFAQLADSHRLDTTVIQQHYRAYHPGTSPPGPDPSTPDLRSARSLGELDQALAVFDNAFAVLESLRVDGGVLGPFGDHP